MHEVYKSYCNIRNLAQKQCNEAKSGHFNDKLDENKRTPPPFKNNRGHVWKVLSIDIIPKLMATLFWTLTMITALKMKQLQITLIPFLQQIAAKFEENLPSPKDFIQYSKCLNVNTPSY